MIVDCLWILSCFLHCLLVFVFFISQMAWKCSWWCSFFEVIYAAEAAARLVLRESQLRTDPRSITDEELWDSLTTGQLASWNRPFRTSLNALSVALSEAPSSSRFSVLILLVFTVSPVTCCFVNCYNASKNDCWDATHAVVTMVLGRDQRLTNHNTAMALKQPISMLYVF